MNWYKIFYLLSVAENLNLFFQWFAGLATISFVIWSAANLISRGDGGDGGDGFVKTSYMKFWYYTIMVFMIAGWTGIVLIPTKKDLIMIIAGGSVGSFIEQDTSIKQIPSDITKFLHHSLQKEIGDLSIETKAELGLATPKETLLTKAKSLTKEELIKLLENDSTIFK